MEGGGWGVERRDEEKEGVREGGGVGAGDKSGVDCG